VDGAINLGEFDGKGDIALIPLTRARTRRFDIRGGKFRWTNVWRIPKSYGGGGDVNVRLDQTDEDRKRGFNRTENLRVIPPSDRYFPRLYRLRQDAESINRTLEDSMWIGRAHSRGHLRQLMNMLGFGLMINSLALHLARGRPPPDPMAR
jgi:hypothetical protein